MNPRRLGPKIMPAATSPNTEGRRKQANISAKNFADIKMITNFKKNSVTSMFEYYPLNNKHNGVFTLLMYKWQCIFTNSRSLIRNIMLIPQTSQLIITTPCIRVYCAARFNVFLNKWIKTISRGVWHLFETDTANTNPFTFNSNNYQRFPLCTSSSFTRFFATIVGLIDFYFFRQFLASRPNHSATQFMHPCPCCTITAKPEHSFQTQCTGTIFLPCHPPDSSKPQSQRLVRILEYGTRDDRHSVITIGTVKQYFANWPGFFAAAMRTYKAIWPSHLKKIITAVLLCRKPSFKLCKGFGIIFHSPYVLHLGVTSVK